MIDDRPAGKYGGRDIPTQCVCCRLLQMRRESSQPLLRVKEPPQSFLELDTCDIDDSEQRLPSEVLYMLRSTR